MIAERILAEAVRALSMVDNHACALDDYLDSYLQLPEERRTLTDLLFAAYRYRGAIEYFLTAHCTKTPPAPVKRVLYAVLTQLWYQTGIRPESAVNVAVSYVRQHISRNASGFCNALLRKAVEEGAPAAAELLPPAVAARWSARFSDAEMAQLRQAWQSRAPLTYRWCAVGEPPAPDDDIPVQADWLSGWNFRRTAMAHSAWLARHRDWLENGSVYIQDPATALAVSLVPWRGDERVLDVCAAPGGKALLMASRLARGGSLTAADRSPERVARLRENLARHRVKCEIITREAQALPVDKKNGFDVVFADVPCSNTGVFRRRPDALWRFSERELAAVVQLQQEIIDHIARLVRPGGCLVYSTCSLEPEENCEQVQAFLARHSGDWHSEAERLLLPSEEHDGAYAAVIRYRGGMAR